MKFRLLLLIPVLCLAGLAIPFAETEKEPEKAANWALTFSDEFGGDSLDRKKWNPRGPWQAVINEELQAYVPNAFEVKNGILKIRIEKRRAQYAGKTLDYSSGMMTTAGKFAQKFGKFEIRCKAPKGNGFWPAFWMLPDDPPRWPPEIDVLEILGKDTDTVYLSHHWSDPKKPGEHAGEDGDDWSGPDFSADFHVITIEWEPDEIRWFVDGVERFKSKKNIPQDPMFLLANLAIGGDWAGAPDDTTPFPAFFEIDYIRAWERSK